MKFNAIIMLSLLSVIFSVDIHAQEQEKSGEQTEATSREETEQPKTGDKDNNGDEKTRPEIAESFTPTEEISEDLSVPFPVDI